MIRSWNAFVIALIGKALSPTQNEVNMMVAIEKIQSEIESLPRREYLRLLQWIHKKDWADWDRELEEDAVSGKLDFLVDEALDQKKRGELGDL